MARFIGKVVGQRGEASRLGHKSLTGTLDGWGGGVRVYLSDLNGADWATITLTGGSNNVGDRVVIYEGPLNADTRKALATGGWG